MDSACNGACLHYHAVDALTSTTVYLHWLRADAVSLRDLDSRHCSSELLPDMTSVYASETPSLN